MVTPRIVPTAMDGTVARKNRNVKRDPRGGRHLKVPKRYTQPSKKKLRRAA